MDHLVRYELRIGRLRFGFARAGVSPSYGWRRIVWRLWFKIDPKRYKRLPG